MRIWIVLLSLAAALPCMARDVYRWTSEDGVIIYSDTYAPGAERVSITTGIPHSAETEATPSDASGETPLDTGYYRIFEIAQPEDGETLRSDAGAVEVGLSLAPALAAGHLIQVYLDGERLGTDLTTTQFSLKQLNWGTHQLQAKVVDAEGTHQTATRSISFHLRKPSLSQP